MSSKLKADIMVAGHVCLDIIPEISTKTGVNLIEPGKLQEIGPAQISTGGAVSNVGIALHKLGIQVRLMGKIGDDLFGREIINRFNAVDAILTEIMLPIAGETSSYTIVVNPKGSDRSFWHHSGCNDTYTAKDVSYNDLEGISLFHFGYPPLMRKMIENDGEELLNLFRKVKATGIVTSLDMAYPDPNSYSGQVDWRKLLKRVLPFVDIFLPSLDEIRYMLGYEINKEVSHEMLSKISGELIQSGTGIVGLKLGEQGFYLRTSHDSTRLENIITDTQQWLNREIYSPCYKVNVKGATGSGDATIAGFLAAIIKGFNPKNVVNTAVAVGACSVEVVDASSGIPDWDSLQKRIMSGWKKHSVAGRFAGMTWDECDQLAYGSPDLKEQ